MPNELNLDNLAEAMRNQQEGKSDGKRIVWDKNTMSFRELGSSERELDSHSPVNDVSKRPFFTK
jgi:hypothetical protein